MISRVDKQDWAYFYFRRLGMYESSHSEWALIQDCMVCTQGVEQDVRLIEMRDLRGQTSLHFVARKGDYEMVKLFCDRNVTVIKKEIDNGEIALHYAAQDRCLEIE